MKTICESCGCHFPEDFEDTQKDECFYWFDRNLGSLPGEYKKIIWDWIFSLNVDEIAEKTGIILNINFEGSNKRYKENEFEVGIPGYKKWSEEKRKQFQKELAKFVSGLSEEEHSRVLMKLFLHKNKKWKEK
jgi:hypothetical protein